MKSKNKSRSDAAARLKRQNKKDNYFNQHSGYGGANDPVNRAVLTSPVVMSQTDVDNQYQFTA